MAFDERRSAAPGVNRQSLQRPIEHLPFWQRLQNGGQPGPQAIQPPTSAEILSRVFCPNIRNRPGISVLNPSRRTCLQEVSGWTGRS